MYTSHLCLQTCSKCRLRVINIKPNLHLIPRLEFMVQEVWMDEDVHAVQHDCQRCLFYSRLNGMVTAHYKSVKSQLWFTRDTEESDFCSDSHYGRFVPAFPQNFAIRSQDFWIDLSWRPLVIFWNVSFDLSFKRWSFPSTLLSEERFLTLSFLLLLTLPHETSSWKQGGGRLHGCSSEGCQQGTGSSCKGGEKGALVLLAASCLICHWHTDS